MVAFSGLYKQNKKVEEYLRFKNMGTNSLIQVVLFTTTNRTTCIVELVPILLQETFQPQTTLNIFQGILTYWIRLEMKFKVRNMNGRISIATLISNENILSICNSTVRHF